MYCWVGTGTKETACGKRDMHRQIYIVREAIVIFTDACTLWCFLVFIWLFTLFVMCVRVFYCVCVCVNLQYVNSFPHFARTAWREQLQIYSIARLSHSKAGLDRTWNTCVHMCTWVHACVLQRCVQGVYNYSMSQHGSMFIYRFIACTWRPCVVM